MLLEDAATEEADPKSDLFVWACSLSKKNWSKAQTVPKQRIFCFDPYPMAL